MTKTSSSSLYSSILALLRKESLSIAELRDATDVSLPTLRQAIDDLISTEWVCKTGQIARTGGRPASLIGLNGKNYLFLGFHLELPGVHCVVSNPVGEIVDHQHLSSDLDLRPNEVVRLIVKYVNQIKTQFSDRQLLGIGIATPGFVDPSSGTILSVGREPQWHDFPLKARLEAEIGLPVIVENDIDCMTFVEIDGNGFNGFNNTDDLIYLGFTEGVKASFFLQGQLYKGPFGNAGLIGHTIVGNNGRSCSCGKHGCLETVASVRAINSLFEELVENKSQKDSSLQRINKLENRNEKFQAILNAADSGDPLCTEIVKDMLNGLGVALVNLVYLLQVEQIVIGGALTNLPEGLLSRLESEVRNNLPPTLSHHIIIRRARRTEPYIAAVGASYRFFYSCIYEETCFTAYGQTRGSNV